MAATARILVLSDIHYAGPAERQRGQYELDAITNRFLRAGVGGYRNYIWRRDPFGHNADLDRFIDLAGKADLVVANGDYSCDSAFVGVSDDAAYESTARCIGKLHDAFDHRLKPVIGDHELGKKSIFGGVGGLRLSSWHRAVGTLGLAPLWQQELGGYKLIGMTSSLIGLPLMGQDMLAEEAREWQALRRVYLDQIGTVFAAIPPGQRLVLFLHDPSALPFLGEIAAVRDRLAQIAMTVVGHLHSPIVLRLSRCLAGVPAIRSLGISVRRISESLRRAGAWGDFNVVLCPALGGIEWPRTGGFLTLDCDGIAGRDAPRVRLESIEENAGGCQTPGRRRSAGGKGKARERRATGPAELK